MTYVYVCACANCVDAYCWFVLTKVLYIYNIHNIYICFSSFRHLWRHVLQTYLHHDIHISVYRSGCPTQSFWFKSKIRAFVCFVCVANLFVLDRHCWTVQRTCTLTFSLLCWCWDQAGNSTTWADNLILSASWHCAHDPIGGCTSFFEFLAYLWRTTVDSRNPAPPGM